MRIYRTNGYLFVVVAVLQVLLLLVVLGVTFGCGTQEGGSEESTKDEVNKEESTQEKADQLSTKEAVGQMFVVGMNGTQPDYYITKMIHERNIGGVILTGPNIASLTQTQTLVSDLQKLSMESSASIPLLIAVDEEGGSVTRAPWIPPQPAAAVVGQTGDPGSAYKVADTVGQNLKEAGINTDLAPVVDTGFGAAIGDRSFGTDPNLVSRMGRAAIEGFEAADIASAAKHFPNHGPADQDSHVGSPIIGHDASTLEAQDLPPFKAAVDEGVPMVMVGHLIYPTIDPTLPASLSPTTIRLLRENLRFEGVIITDALNMEGAKRGGTVAQAAVEAVGAGADMLLLSAEPQEQADAYEAVVQAVEKGQISQEQINQSVERILRLKERYHVWPTKS
ncbi:MAG: glycoside hydrolase family 3 protein [Rubrobacter sp.]|nr:glycoside hydrolase family 3 protein [Rubrobacter sp.]